MAGRRGYVIEDLPGSTCKIVRVGAATWHIHPRLGGWAVAGSMAMLGTTAEEAAEEAAEELQRQAEDARSAAQR